MLFCSLFGIANSIFAAFLELALPKYHTQAVLSMMRCPSGVFKTPAAKILAAKIREDTRRYAKKRRKRMIPMGNSLMKHGTMVDRV
jgi:hypothetical protein